MNLTEDFTLVDLSHKLDPNPDYMSIIEGMPQFKCCPILTHEKDGASVHAISLSTHTGTHVDAPSHFISNGNSVDQIPIKSLVGNALVVDLTHKSTKEIIGWEDLSPYAEKMNPGVILLLNTGWSKFWATGKYWNHPYLNTQAAEEIIKRGIKVLGLDTPSPDASGTGEYDVHILFLGSGGCIVENLTNLEKLRGDKVTVNLLPLNIVGSDGAPVRGIGWEET